MQFAAAIQALSDSDVDFVVIGGVAANLHGSAVVTFDLDVCYSRASANLSRLVGSVRPFHPRPRGFPADLPFVWDEATLRKATVLTLQTDLGELDLLAEVAGLGSFGEVKDHAIEVEAFGRKILVLDLPGLIRAKKATGRRKDILALPELEGLLEASEN